MIDVFLPHTICIIRCARTLRSVSHSLGSTSGLQIFMNSLTEHYVRVSNEVLARNVSKTPADLRVDIDEKQHAVDVNIAPKRFVDGWNAATTDPDTRHNRAGKNRRLFVQVEIFWCLGPLIQACRFAFADCMRKQFDVMVKSKPYVSDGVCTPNLPP